MTQSDPVALPELPEPTERGDQMHDFPPSLYTSDAMKAFGFQCYARGVMKGNQRTPAVALSDEQILHVWDIFVGEPTSKDPFTDADKVNFARALLARATERGQA